MSIVLIKKVIKANKKFDEKGILRATEKILRKTATDVRKDYHTITKTWNHDIELDTYLEATGKDATLIVGTADLIFKFLDEGTKVRYATMSKDFKAKTKPGRLSSTAGRGRMLFVSKRRPRPGIKARGWTPKIKERATAKFQKYYLAEARGMFTMK